MTDVGRASTALTAPLEANSRGWAGPTYCYIDTMTSRLLLRTISLLACLLFLGLGPIACGIGAEDVESSDANLTFAPRVKGYVNGRIVDLTPEQALSLQFVSHEKILTWEGLVADYGKPSAEVHLVDTTKFDGHYGYTKNAIGRGDGFTEANFQTEIQYPRTRRYMPFLAFDFRAHPITVAGKPFKWVMNLRRYNYRDTHEELAQVVVTMRKMLSERLFASYGEPVLFVYDSDFVFQSTGTPRRPHINHLAEIRREGFDVITEGDMIRLAGGELVSVLNPGVAFGHLKLVAPGAAEERLTPRHIAVFQDTPDRVPPVAGIVTLEPQTPLSHINLLAKNRGTPNASTAHISLVPQMQELLGKLVRMEAKADGTIAFREASLEEATAFWESRQQQSLQVPAIAPLSHDPVEFATDDAAKTALSNIGSKASNYAAIQKLLGPTLVKPGFGLGFAHYKSIVAGAPAEGLIADLIARKDALTPEQVDERLVAIRTAIQTQTPASSLVATIAAVRSIAARLPGVARIRLRSSTNSEDLPVFNGAGLYLSNGFDVADSDAKLQKKILEVMSSLWLERAFWERELFGIDHAAVAMAVLVNPAFSDELANGVVVGQPDGGAFSSWVNAQKGEASVTNPENGEVPESFNVGLRGGALALTKLDSRSNLGTIFLDPSSSALVPSLTPQLRQLHDATKVLHDHFVGERIAAGDTQRYAIDLEYKLMNEGGTVRLYIKQSRLLALR